MDGPVDSKSLTCPILLSLYRLLNLFGEKLSFLASQQTGTAVFFTLVQKTTFLELSTGDDEAGAGICGSSVPQEALSGLLVGLSAASSQHLLQMRRLKAAEHRLML